MSAQYLVRIQPTRNGFLLESTREEDAIVAAHFKYLQQLTQEGRVLMAGRTLNTDSSSHGLIVFRANSEEHVTQLMGKDPAIRAGVFRAELFPFRVAMASREILA
jgi:uncharacterized protein YciI